MLPRLFGAVLVLSEGIVVGSALVAFLTVLDVIPRIAQATKTMRCVRLYERAVFGGALLGSITDIVPAMQLPVLVTCVVGLVTGLFTGLFTAALAEVLNVLPVFGRRFNIERSITVLVVALAAGKALGSLVYWLLPQLQP